MTPGERRLEAVEAILIGRAKSIGAVVLPVWVKNRA